MAKAYSPTSAEIESHILASQKKFPKLVSVRNVRNTDGGRPIYAVTITDTRVSDKDKQNVLITAGQHGNEETGREVALATMDWLLSKAGAATIRNQKIVIMPNVNPDGADVDDHYTPTGGMTNLDHAVTGPVSPEGKAVEEVAYELQPEAYADLHSRGHAGCSHDMVLFPYVRPYTEDDYIFHQVAADMYRAAEASGIPQVTHPLTWPGWGSDDINAPSTTWFAYRTFKSIVMLTENSESNEFVYPAKARRASGLQKLKAMLAWGNRRYPKLYYPGYPCYLLSGFFKGGSVAVGKTAAARRASRIAMNKNRECIKKCGFIGLEQLLSKSLVVEYEGPAMTEGFGLQFQTFGRREVKSIKVNGLKIRKSETNGYYTWNAAGGTFVVIAFPEMSSGKYEVQAEFK